MLDVFLGGRWVDGGVSCLLSKAGEGEKWVVQRKVGGGVVVRGRVRGCLLWLLG